MKTLRRLIVLSALLGCFESTAQADIIYQNAFPDLESVHPFRAASGPGPGDVLGFWSLSGTIESIAGNPYARYAFDTISSPPNSQTRWSGGFYSEVNTATELPAQWQLSFDVSLNIVEPLQVTFRFKNSSSFPPAPVPTMTFWVQPSDVGWQQIVIDQNTAFSLSSGADLFPASATGTYLSVAMASHDADGNPLSISQIGEHDFLLDNITFQSIPEPSAFSCVSMAAILSAAVRRYRAK
jgi:hypothetical protein